MIGASYFSVLNEESRVEGVPSEWAGPDLADEYIHIDEDEAVEPAKRPELLRYVLPLVFSLIYFLGSAQARMMDR
jgi:hypothetical protein